MRSSNLQAQLEEIALPGHAKEGQELGRESMKSTYGLSPADIALLRSGTVHVAPWEAGVVHVKAMFVLLLPGSELINFVPIAKELVRLVSPT